LSTVLYCHTKYYPESLDSVFMYAPGAIGVYTGRTSFSYSEALAYHWDYEGDLIVIEHDIVIDENTIPSFEDCQEPWCSFKFDVMGQDIDFALGCTKWSAEARKLVTPPARANWRTLDVQIRELMIWVGLQPHVHGKVAHLHPYEPGMNRFDETLGTLLKLGKAEATAAGSKGPPLPPSPF
jgi:hypothetical protein